jgi:hypothetical protein
VLLPASFDLIEMDDIILTIDIIASSLLPHAAV